MNRDQLGDDEPERSTTRRRLLLSSGAIGAAVLAGCGGPGTGVGTNGSPTDGGIGTESPMGTAEPTETEVGTETETSTETDGATETGEETETDAETETGTETGGEARVRVVHLSPNAPNVDLYVDGSAVLEDVAFGTVSDYLALTAGTYTVEITAAGDPDTSVFEGDVTVEADTVYTIAAIGEVGDGADQPFEPLVLTDETEPPAGDMARLRVVHASPDAPAVDITAGGDVLFDGVAYGESGYVEVPSGDYTVEIRGDTPENDGEVVQSFDVSLAGGQVYTAFAAGYLSPDDEPADTPFDLIIAEDTEA